MRTSTCLIACSVISTVAALGGCGPIELNGRERPALRQGSSLQDAEIAPREMAGRALEPGLWVTVSNNLPVIRQNGQIISQAFLEAELVAFDEYEQPASHSTDGAEGGQAAGPASQQSQEHERSATSVRYVLRGRVLSESTLSFWISPERLDLLVKKSGGNLTFGIKDSVQYSSFPFPCSIGGNRALHQIRPSSEVDVQHLRLTVEGRYRMSYKCSLNELAAGGAPS